MTVLSEPIMKRFRPSIRERATRHGQLLPPPRSCRRHRRKRQLHVPLPTAHSHALLASAVASNYKKRRAHPHRSKTLYERTIPSSCNERCLRSKVWPPIRHAVDQLLGYTTGIAERDGGALRFAETYHIGETTKRGDEGTLRSPEHPSTSRRCRRRRMWGTTCRGRPDDGRERRRHNGHTTGHRGRRARA